jgi:DNA mismatch repair protein MutS
MPTDVIERAKQVLWSLEQSDHVGGAKGTRGGVRSWPTDGSGGGRGHARPTPADQLALFGGAPDPLVEELRSMDVNALTPLEALNKLAELQRRAEVQSFEGTPTTTDESEETDA